MTSTNGSEPGGTSGSNDPAVLAAEIEKTREDLAETLDAIAEKVSPKRVAGRTKKKVAEAVASAKDAVVEQAGAAKDKVVEQAGTAKGKVAEATSSGAAAQSPGGSTRLPGAPDAVTAPVDPLPPVTAVQADHLDLTTPAATTAPAPAPTSTFPTAPYAAPGPLMRKEYVAGAGLGVLVLVLLRRRRTKRRAGLTKGLAKGLGTGLGKAPVKGRKRR